MKYLLPLIILTFVQINLAQESNLPDHGSIADLKGKTKAYIIADAENTKQILKGLKNQKVLIVVNRPEDAEMFLDYKETAPRSSVTSLEMSSITGQLDVYIYRQKRKIIAWSDSKVSALRWPSLSLTKRFVKEFTNKRKTILKMET